MNESFHGASLEKVFGYKGDNMNLPVKDLAEALPFYENVLGFKVVSRSESPQAAAILGRDQIKIRLAENGGDPSQDGCAFHVNNVEVLLTEFKANGLQKELSDLSNEEHGEATWKVFYVVAPDGLCYWFGEQFSNEAQVRPNS